MDLKFQLAVSLTLLAEYVIIWFYTKEALKFFNRLPWILMTLGALCLVWL